MKSLALYIHIPFCKEKCFYCDFPSYAGLDKLMDEYIEALEKEINIRCKDVKIRSLFIGGGTPSHLSLKGITSLMNILSSLNYEEKCEKTIECNPGTLSLDKLIEFKKGGINRLSFGLQSTKDALLKDIGRIHDFTTFKENLKLARECGFENINVDLMFGLPNQKVEDYITSLKEIIKLKVPHISAYSLIIEEGTLFFANYEKGFLKLPSEEEEREMYEEGKELLIKEGYHQYEISNFSKAKKECYHNKVYWRVEEYIGVGSSSSSFINNKRIKNIDGVSNYIKRINENNSAEEEVYENTLNDSMEEFMFMGLRMNEGISIEEFRLRFNKDIDEIYKDVISSNINKGLLLRESGRIKLTKKGIELSNLVMSDMIL